MSPDSQLHKAQTVFRTALRGLERIHEGKVRDIYAVDADSLLIVTTDRLSAFDVVLPDPIPDKGRVLNQISNFWFACTRHIVPNHLTDRPLASVVKDAHEPALLEGRAAIVRRLRTPPPPTIASRTRLCHGSFSAARSRLARAPSARATPATARAQHRNSRPASGCARPHSTPRG